MTFLELNVCKLALEHCVPPNVCRYVTGQIYQTREIGKLLIPFIPIPEYKVTRGDV